MLAITERQAIVAELQRRLMLKTRDPATVIRMPSSLHIPDNVHLTPIGRCQCPDGFSISVQASRLTYCTPRENDGPWKEVEAGYPSEADALLTPWAEDTTNPTQTVYPHIDVEVVAEAIARHGGLLPCASP